MSLFVRRRTPKLFAAAAAASLVLTACGSTDQSATVEEDSSSESSDGAQAGSDTESGKDSQWFDQATFDEQMEQRDATFEGDEAEPWLQYIDGEMTDTSDLAVEGPQKACFANASISNPWRQTGWITMNQQLEVMQEEGVISEMETRDAKDDDNTQIADIDYFIEQGDCGVFIISPNSTAAMTPAVERACETGKPVIVFDRGVETDCPTTFIHPIGGYAWGIDTANFLSENLEEGDKVVALRILPGVDVLENRWAAADQIFSDNGIEAVDYFTGADPAEIKKIISDELAKGDVQGVWMDAGDGAVAAIEAFEDAGADLPVMTGEDEMSFLRKWEETGLTGLAPVYSNFQWRTPLLAAQKIFAGEEVPKEWVLPQTPITEDERADFLEANDGMPDGHYAKFGGEDLPGYPQVWEERQIP
ncbi:substrate-binding domain-containing protein [Nocardioides marmoraquaticus]